MRPVSQPSQTRPSTSWRQVENAGNWRVASMPHAADVLPRVLGRTGDGRECVRADLRGLVAYPRDARPESRRERAVDPRQVAHVVGCVAKLRLAERAPAPRGPLLLLVERRAD